MSAAATDRVVYSALAVLIAVPLFLLAIKTLGGRKPQAGPAAPLPDGTWQPGETVPVLPMPATRITSVPPVHGHHIGAYDGRYRLWTIGHGLRYDAVPRYAEGGPVGVAIGGWIVSTSSLDRGMSSPSVVAADDGMVTLNVWRGDAARPDLHPLSGTRYPSRAAADRAAYDAGVHGLMVYERDAARFNLPHRL